ncbi:MAG TPA: cytochrome P450 [Mycobacteriales bacterium]|nr:cytochrome P450 [Mycobacteriales bacterium]
MTSGAAGPRRHARTISLGDPDLYAAGAPHALFAQLRREAPLHRQVAPDGTAYWAVLSHAGVETVARQPLLFSSAAGGVMLEDLAAPQLEQMRGMLLAMDPPVHREVRRPVVARLTPRAVAGLEQQVREICTEVFETARSKGEVDVVGELAAPLPTRVVGRLMGLPRDDWERIHHLAERITRGQDPEFADEPGAAGVASQEMALYAFEFATARLAAEEKPDDLTTVLLASKSAIEFASLFVQLVTAGQDTTQTLLANGVLALMEHRDQERLLRDDPSLVDGAVEEMLRYANPLHYFRRTATADTEVEGTVIAAGDKVAMYYTSANRDERVFDRPDDFDIRRSPNRHLSFGHAEHFCVGAHLARLEAKVFFTELLSTFSGIEPDGEHRWVRSNLNNALRTLPVRLTPAAG